MKQTGRPSKYDEIYITRIDDYLKECQDEEAEFHKTRGDKSDSYDRLIKVRLPTIEDFGRYIGVHKDTLYEWESIHPKFSDALEKIRVEQKQRLIENGLSGDYNPMIAKLVLAANHDMTDRTDITTKGEPIRITFDDSFNK